MPLSLHEGGGAKLNSWPDGQHGGRCKSVSVPDLFPIPPAAAAEAKGGGTRTGGGQDSRDTRNRSVGAFVCFCDIDTKYIRKVR